jgi:hypothetical protein
LFQLGLCCLLNWGRWVPCFLCRPFCRWVRLDLLSQWVRLGRLNRLGRFGRWVPYFPYRRLCR